MPLASPLRLGETGRVGTSTIPRLVYGTAWKEGRSSALVTTALSTGFRGVDTAAQPRHYREDLVGAGIRAFLASPAAVARENLYIQTKFTPSQAPGPGVPYDLSAPIEDQVASSIASSLRNLAAGDENSHDDVYLDCVVLHSPLPSAAETLAAWRALETHVPHPVRRLGISNVSLAELERLHAEAVVKPSVVQNRFYPRDQGGGGYAAGVRKFCEENGIVFQSFWTLTGNPALAGWRVVGDVVDALGGRVEKEVAVYALVMALGRVCVLDGTTREEGMKGDLEGLEVLAAWAEGEGKHQWEEAVEAFKRLVNRDA
ncbi:aldo/keto reductase [Plectosphaerella cucumerina]|uniref:Aldo/keto reductase n=1 Tax=Plectosphaerella cucumerina TaxID=40658 RepID=A0A8K0TLT0_9PEZI|nr:aldo/keto reductase [Plectosphaerella cucumerina]